MTTPLTIPQVRAMAVRMKPMDKTLFTAILLSGARARTWTWGEALNDMLSLPSAVYYSLRALATGRELALVPFNFARYTDAHWLGGVSLKSPIFTSDKSNGKPLTTQDISRRFDRYGRMVGVQCVSLRTVANTHRSLLAVFGSADAAAEALGFESPPSTPTLARVQARTSGQEVKERLHGIGRRPRVSVMRSS